jgi:hypothetical protein
LLRALFIVAVATLSLPVMADSPYLFIFESANARAVAGLARQKARAQLAQRDYDRARRLVNSQAISQEEYESFRAVAILSALDLKIADLKAQESSLTLQLANALARTGKRIPLCMRKKQVDQDTVSSLLKKLRPASKTKPPQDLQGTGTQLQVSKTVEDNTPPTPPDVKPPVNPPDVPPPVVPPVVPPDIDVPPPVKPKPPPKPTS